MRIGISGTSCCGKTTFIADFIKNWQNYSTPVYDYRAKLKELPHSKLCNKETQWTILNSMVDEMQKHSKGDYVIYDRTPIDNLVYSMWANAYGEGDVDNAFVSKCIPVVRESLRMLDVVFFIPLTKVSPIPIVPNGTRETDPVYIEEIDNIFKALYHDYQNNIEKSVYFPKEDCPGIIEIFGKRQERIYLCQQYINPAGNILGEEHDTILNPNNIEHLQDLLKNQTAINEVEKKERKDIEKIKSQLEPNYINGGKRKKR